jgi:hypothetical protein
VPYYIWIPIEILLYIGAAFLSIKIQQDKGWFWFGVNCFTAAIPLWGLIARKSTNIVFDGLLYDVILIVTYSIFLIYLSKDYSSMKLMNFVGAGMVMLGLIFFKIKW